MLIHCPFRFQFHIGSIQSPAFRPVLDCSHILFQFHIGSIQSSNDHLSLSVDSRFQFHIGSIQRPDHYFHASVYDTGFNSTLVRFKGGSSFRLPFVTGVSIPHWFDSKAIYLRDGFICLYWFQFHIGSIQRTLWIGQFQYIYTGFNSTLVRFKVKVIALSCPCLLWFQFHIGSIQRLPRAP